MRLTQRLFQQHVGFMFKTKWVYQGKRVPLDAGIERIKSKGIEVVDANDFVNEKRENFRLDVIGPVEIPIPLDKNHPDWKERVCHAFKETNVLLEGLIQAQVLTKSVTIADSLPEAIEEAAQITHPPEIHHQMKKAALSANVFDCQQEKLPKIKDPERPAVNFPRILGITDSRKNLITTNKLLSILERNSDGIAKERFVTHDPEIVTSFEKDGDLLQFQMSSNTLITSTKPIGPAVSDLDSFVDVEIPDMFPVNHIITIPKINFYDTADFYPINRDSKWFHPHTTFLHYNKTQVKNIHETPVTENQILGRSLIHAFTIAAAYARTLYGKDVTLLPNPVTVQCVQTDGCNFYLGVLQLNNLDSNGRQGVKNIWYKSPTIRLYEKCEYSKGIPVLEGYNPQVYNYVHAMYKNQ